MVEIQYKNAKVKLGLEELVYEPAEDSFLLADAALKELENLGKARREKAKNGKTSEIGKAEKAGQEMRILEIGTGSGFISAVLQASPFPVRVLATEINPHAALCAKENGVEVLRADLFGGVKPAGKKRHFDLILFNPPYLPTSKEEKVPGWLNYAFDGGLSGRETLNRFLDKVRAYLSLDGEVLLLISSITGEAEVKEKMKKLGFEVESLSRKKVSFEELIVLRGRILESVL